MTPQDAQALCLKIYKLCRTHKLDDATDLLLIEMGLKDAPVVEEGPVLKDLPPAVSEDAKKGFEDFMDEGSDGGS